MAAYVVPLSVFRDLLSGVDPSLHPELAERLRIEIQADIGRRLRAHDLSTSMGEALESVDSVISGDKIIFFDPRDPPQGLLGSDPAPSLSSVMNDAWRYPGDARDGLFAASVTAVIVGSSNLVQEISAENGGGR